MNIQKTLIVPDVHGRPFYKPVLQNTEDKIIFLGDYTDPYAYEGYTTDDSINAMMEIFSFAQDNPSRIILLLGNHDYPYFINRRGYARYDWRNAKKLHEIFMEFKDLFKIAYWDENTETLFTHAGVTMDWWKDYEFPINPSGKEMEKLLNNLLEVKDFNGEFDPLEQIGRARGGYSRYGSCIWAHVTEHAEEEQLPIKQIAAHSQLAKTGSFIRYNNLIMCDSRSIFEYNGNLDEFHSIL